MKYYIELQGTCWLVQYLNYINKEYDKDLFFKCLALNRFLRYKNAIKLVNNKELINTKEYLLETLLTFEGSLFDIEDILNYKINGNLKNDIKLEDIMLMNEKVLMFLLEMYDNNIDLSNKIFEELNKTIGNLKFEKNIKSTLNIVISNPKLECKKINLINSENLYHTQKIFYNVQNVNEIIDRELAKSKQVLVSIDIAKSVTDINKIIYPKGIKADTLNKFISIDNHYYILTEKITLNKETYYKAFTGYQNDEYVLISNKYLKEFLNHMICDKIKIKEETTLDFYKYMEE